MNRQMKEKQKTVQTLKKSPFLTGLSFLHATLLLRLSLRFCTVLPGRAEKY